MSRLSSMSPSAVKALFTPDSSDTVLFLVTFYDADSGSALARLTTGFTKRIYESNDEVLYGVTSRGNDFTFMPIEISPPSENDNTAPSFSITMNDVSQYIVPIIRQLGKPPRVLLEVVLASTPDVIEASFDEFYVTNFTYDAQKVVANMEMTDYSVEPFPCYTFTPAFFPGLF